MDRIIEGIQQFQRNIFPSNRALFEKLASGQSPEALFIACSDSRVSLEWITQCGPGDLFVCRNAGNVAPSHSASDAVSGTIEYALSVLRIKHIVVCGHSDCGAMKGLLHPEALREMPDVQRWLSHCEHARRALDNTGMQGDGPEVVAALAKLNVRLQLEHLRTHPQVLSRYLAGSLELHGWYYQIDSGEVQAWDASESRWKAIHEPAPMIPATRVVMAGKGVQHA